MMLTRLLSLAPTFRCLCYYSITDDSREDKCTQEKQGTILQFLNLSQFFPHFKVGLDNCIYFTSQLLQVNNIVLSGNIYLEEESYPNAADNLSKDK